MIKRVNILLSRINLEQRFLQKIFEIQLLKYSKRGLICLKNLIWVKIIKKNGETLCREDLKQDWLKPSFGE